MTSKHQRLWLAFVACVLAINLAVGFRVYSNEAERSGEAEAFEKISIMMRVLQLVRKDYVDAEKVDFEKLIYSALKGMVRSLDPYSGFMPPDEFKSMVETTEGEFGGLGVIVTVREDVLTVVAPIEDTPGSRAGLLAGDKIVKIDDESTKGMSLDDCVSRLKGLPGTSVVISVYRPETEQNLDFTIERAVIPIRSVRNATVLRDKIGYLRISQFSEPTAEALGAELKELEEKEIDSLILDVRNNPGGLLDSAVDVCNYFLPPGKLVVSTEGRHPSQQQEFRTGRGSKYEKLPIAILVNGGSASAAEILSGCLQDWGRAVLIGTKTFGKGSVQNVMELPDGSAVRLTTAMYYTPSRHVIHNRGIEPDIQVKLTREEIEELIEEQRSNGNGPFVPSSADRQLQRAVDVLLSYDVYLKARNGKFRKLAPGKPDEADDDGDSADDGEEE